MKKYFYILLVGASLSFGMSGCNSTMNHTFNDRAWLQEQVQQGVITQAQADEIWQAYQSNGKN